MRDAANARARYRVSPYLEDAAFDPGDYGVAASCHMLYDHFHRCHTLLSAAAYEHLLDARLDNRELSAADVTAFGDEGNLLVSAHVILPAEDVFRIHRYESVEIEINRHCNYRCVFCPVSLAPKPAALMDEATYRRVIDRVVEYGARIISLNHYSEPTLHPRFVEYCEIARAHGRYIRLHTNASRLDEGTIVRLSSLSKYMRVFVNLPTVDERAFEAQTRATILPRVLRHLELLHRHGFKVTLSVNTPRADAGDTMRAINSRLSDMFGDQVQWPTDDRAGLLEQPAYAPPVHHTGRLNGCRLAMTQVNVSYTGDVFLCCQDFHQEYVVGNILEAPLRTIAEGEPMIALRRSIFGGEAITDSFLCARCSKSCAIGAVPRGFSFAATASANTVRKGRPIHSVLTPLVSAQHVSRAGMTP